MSKAEPGSIQETGANTLDLVEGMTDKNRGLLLRVKQPQNKYENGSLKGRFEIVAEGTGYYADKIRPLVGQTMNGSELIESVIVALGTTRMQKLTILDRNSLRVVPTNQSSPND